MSGSAILGNRQLIFADLPVLLRFSRYGKSHEGFKKWGWPLSCYPSSSILGQTPGSRPRFLARASSAASFPPLSGSAVDCSEKLLGVIPKQSTQRLSSKDREEIEDPRLIADPDSCFCEFNGVQLHHKICDAEVSASSTTEESLNNVTRRAYYPMVLLHGFGSSTFSWNQIMKPLAQISRSKILAFDRPAFGLTSRVSAMKHSPPVKADATSISPYSMMFSVLATLFFVDLLDAEKVILVGHSAGSLVALDTYFEAPERVSALILVAPAIFVPFSLPKVSQNKPVGSNDQRKGNSSHSVSPRNIFQQLCSILLKITKFISEIVVKTVKAIGDTLNSLYNKALAAILRSALGVMVIRMIIEKFGIPAIRAAWFDSNQVSDQVLQSYTKPLKVKGWDRALVEYTVAMLTDSTSKIKLPLDKRLKDISCPVLIVTGDTDRLVPCWNSERLSRAIPGSCLEIIKNCGHLPQEEKAEEFVSVIAKFLQSVFIVEEEPLLQVVS